jgi:hypothetical protein
MFGGFRADDSPFLAPGCAADYSRNGLGRRVTIGAFSCNIPGYLGGAHAAQCFDQGRPNAA